MASNTKVIYIGMTSDLNTRVIQHKTKFKPNSFASKYNCNKLVYYEKYNYVNDAIAREKQLKKWRREKKAFLIEQDNINWIDLAQDWGEE